MRRRTFLSWLSVTWAQLIPWAAWSWSSLSSRGPTLTIVTDHLPRGVVDQPYSVTLTASGGTPPYSWSLASQHPSGWLTLGSTTGVLSGTPHAAGIEEVRIEVKDA